MAVFVEVPLYLSSGVSPDNICFLLEFGKPSTFDASPDPACREAEFLFLTADPRGRYKNDITTRLFSIFTLRVSATSVSFFPYQHSVFIVPFIQFTGKLRLVGILPHLIYSVYGKVLLLFFSLYHKSFFSNAQSTFYYSGLIFCYGEAGWAWMVKMGVICCFVLLFSVFYFS